MSVASPVLPPHRPAAPSTLAACLIRRPYLIKLFPRLLHPCLPRTSLYRLVIPSPLPDSTYFI
ncbi:hypothetical protein E2C01_007406 [Portunus trituberculatus]|uniref:Uncharacterized protein n=1 Tax=Portunus trituberculatus TaxID=210409 RepID=A0A5B7D2C8_PORTR|nr:hypothetical protein [Portunus trituberculatus]